MLHERRAAERFGAEGTHASSKDRESYHSTQWKPYHRQNSLLNLKNMYISVSGYVRSLSESVRSRIRVHKSSSPG